MESKCVICKLLKPVNEFYKDSRMRSGVSSECKECKREKSRRYLRDNPEHTKKMEERKSERRKEQRRVAKSLRPKPHPRDYGLRKYGITHNDYKRQYDIQHGKCHLCKVEWDVLYVDHCHATGNVRGLLCKFCNWGLGHFKDNPETILRAVEYLESEGIWK